MTQNRLQMWVIYDHPSDYPNYFVARCWEGEAPTDRYLFKTTLEDLRFIFEEMGLYRMPRYIEDDPCIVEVWF